VRQKSGSQAAALREFRRMLKRALGELVVNEDIRDWRIERPSDLVYVERGKATSKAQGRHLSRKKGKAAHTAVALRSL
jgi:hypothetical protein